MEERIINNILSRVKELYRLDDYDLKKVNEHEGGRNIIYICECNHEKEYVIRISLTGDRTQEDYLAETEFVHYLAEGGASVADVMPSVNGKLVEIINDKGKDIFVSLFNYAKGMLISDKGYCYIEGAPLSEYFYNTGKTLGKIHKLSKGYSPKHKRMDYFDKYNMDYLNQLMSDEYLELKKAIAKKLELFHELPQTEAEYGLVHFDYSDGNYHIDYSNGRITVFDFDNCMKCWYMFDLANLWTHGVGWCQYEKEVEKRKEFMEEYFRIIIDGYRSETKISEEILEKLPLFIDMVLIENIVDEFECCQRIGEEPDYENMEDAVRCLIEDISYAGFLL